MFDSVSLLTYAVEPLQEHARNMAYDAFCVGFDKVSIYNPEYIYDTDFWHKNIVTLERFDNPYDIIPGYGLWRPYIILEELKKTPENGALIYSDTMLYRTNIGKINELPGNLLKLLSLSEAGYIAGMERIRATLGNYIKKDVFERFGLNFDEWKRKPLLSAKWSLWRPTPQSFEFLHQWLELCQNSELLYGNGNNNDKDFRHHLGCEALLSILTYMNGGSYITIHNKKMVKHYISYISSISCEDAGDYFGAINIFFDYSSARINEQEKNWSLSRNRSFDEIIDISSYVLGGKKITPNGLDLIGDQCP